MGNKGSKSKSKGKQQKQKADVKAAAKAAAKADEVKVSEEEKSSVTSRITVHVIQAKNLPKYDPGPTSKSDPYVKVQFGDLPNGSYKTSYITKDLNPVWNASFSEEGVGIFKSIKEIQFQVFDKDTLSQDDLMGSCSLSVFPDPQRFFSSPVQWVLLKDEKGEAVKDKDGKDSMLQVGIRYTPKVEDLNIRHWTHVMELTVKKGCNIKSTDFLSRSDPYVQLEFGYQSKVTKTIKNAKEPEWNETAFFFVHEKYNQDTQMKMTVMDKDMTKDDLLGTGYTKFQVLAKAAEGDGKVTANLRQVPVGSDKGLLDVDEDGKVWGDLELEVKMIPAKEVEDGFFKALLGQFDKNADGVIDRDELREMFAYFKVKDNVDELMQKFDENNDEKLDEKEVIQMMRDANFQESKLATQLVNLHVNGQMDSPQEHLMQGFTKKHHAGRKTLKIKDRDTGLIVQEHIPTYVDWALRLVYDVGVNRKLVQTKFALKSLERASSRKGDAMDQEKSAEDIPGFIKQHNLDSTYLYRKKFKTFNNFFARGMDVAKCRPLAAPEDDSVVVSPADCRMMVWDTILDSTKVWIKGASFTLENLLGPNTKVDLKKYEGGSFGIARLAPQDYHRWHYPVGGKVVNIERIDGALYTVNPIAINREVDVYTENKRAIVEIDGGKNGGCVMFAIAATMVGSYNLFRTEAEDPVTQEPVELKEGDIVKRGDVAGEFRFGGSTVLILFEPNRVKWDEDIQRNVSVKFETLLNVRSRIGQILSKDAAKADDDAKEAEEEKPADEKPAEDKPAEDKPAEDKPAEDKPAEEEPKKE